MNRNMRMLHKENNRLDKTLCEDYQKLMTDIVCYLRGADISELQQEKVRYDLTLMLLEAQQRNAPLDEVFPEDYKAFCDTKHLSAFLINTAAGYPAGHKRRLHCAVDLPQQL